MRILVVFILLLLVPAVALADPPSTPLTSFSTAKKKARNEVYSDHRITLYCSCAYSHSTSASGGVIDATACGYEVRVSELRGGRLEWEHIMPAFEFGHLRTCWRVGHSDCVKDGTPFKGRKCCEKSGVDPEFRKMEADLHNLAPSVGELNADRSNHPYGWRCIVSIDVSRRQKNRVFIPIRGGRSYGNLDHEFRWLRPDAPP